MKKCFAAIAVVVSLLLAACGGGSSHHAVTRKLTPGPTSCPGAYVTQWGCSAHSPTFGLPPTGPPRLTAPSSTPTVAMYDSVSISVLPHDAPAYGGYLFGLYPTFAPIVTSFPRAYHVPIAPQAQPVYPSTVKRMVCLDVEPFDATPSEAGPWARGELALGLKPCIYASLRNGMSEAEQSVAQYLGAGWRAKVFLWDADWTGSPQLDAGFDATQWTDHFSGLNVDASVVTPSFLGIKPGPAPVPNIGGAQHYQNYPADAPARPRRERQSVIGWDTGNGSGSRCENPVRRPSCKITRTHLIYDLQRDQALYRRDSKKQRNQLHLPGRIQGLSHRINNHRGIVNRWL